MVLLFSVDQEAPVIAAHRYQSSTSNMRIASLAGAFTSLLGLASAASFSNPLRPFNGSDPHMTYYDGHYYLMTTTWTNLQITRAKTLEGLKNGETRVVWTDADPSRCCNV